MPDSSGCPFPVQLEPRRPYSAEMNSVSAMSPPRARSSARSVTHIAALSLMLLGVALGVMIASLRVIEAAMDWPHPPGGYWLFNALVAIVFSICGAAIAVRRPANPIGWAFIAGALGNGIAGIGGEYTVLTGDPIGVWLLTWAWMPLPLAIAVTLHTFPTGQALTLRWRRVLVGALVAGVLGIIVQATSPAMAGAPSSFPGLPVESTGPAVDGRVVVNPSAMITGIGSLILRFRRSRGDQRAAAQVAPRRCIPLLILSIVGIEGIVVSAATLMVAVPVATAILRYRLYDIDLIINRALVYGVLGLLVAAAYLVLGTVFGRLPVAKARRRPQPWRRCSRRSSPSPHARRCRRDRPAPVWAAWRSARGLGSVARRLESAGRQRAC